jgi:polyphosphate glucokinase
MNSTTGRPGGTLLGIDIGGTGIKGAPVDLARGVLAADRRRLATPHPATPAAVAETVAAIADAFPLDGPIGITFPAIVRRGRVESAANVDPAWIGTDAQALFAERLGRPVVVVNDADAAGLAEMAYGAGRGRMGVVVMVTFGTGIGTALFLDGRLVPNTELGHIIVSGSDGEKLAAASVKDRADLSWKKWSKRVDAYLGRLESLVSPDTIIVGGGVSKDHAHFLPRLHARAEVVPAELFNDAGIVGGALAAVAPGPTAPSAGRRPAMRVAREDVLAVAGR